MIPITNPAVDKCFPNLSCSFRPHLAIPENIIANIEHIRVSAAAPQLQNAITKPNIEKTLTSY